MINLNQLFQLIFLCLFGYLLYLVREAVELYKSHTYTDYERYQRTIRQTGSTRKPFRDRDTEGIHRVKGDRRNITVRGPSGIASTKNELVSITQADPEAVMDSIDEYGMVKE